MAQNVYSLNVVGYYNVPTPSGISAVANQLNTGSGATLNRADVVIPYSDSDNIQIWNGASWDVWSMDSLSATGWLNPAGADAPLASLPIIGAGKGILYGKNTAITQITFVGEVRVGTTVINLPGGLTATGSPNPLSGLVSTGPINLQVADGDNIQKWNGASWDVYSRDSLSATGWLNPAGADGPEPTLNVGQGIFYGNNGLQVVWTQTITIP